MPTIAGFFVLWLVLDRSAAWLGSLSGEGGLIVCALVLAVAILLERLLFAQRPLAALRDLGLVAPAAPGLVAALVLSAALLAFYPVWAALTGTPLTLRDGWVAMLPGLFAQGGVAEETVFRGYLFRHFRTGRTFWRAALVSAVPFVAVHLLLFATLAPAIAAASVVLAVSISFPLAWLFERGGNTVWAPAVVHFVVQGSIKVVETADAFAPLVAAWIVLAAVLPWAVFLMRPARPAPA